jgi:hypothetical protein
VERGWGSTVRKTPDTALYSIYPKYFVGPGIWRLGLDDNAGPVRFIQNFVDDLKKIEKRYEMTSFDIGLGSVFIS